MKKFLAILLVFVLMFTLVACGDDNQNEDPIVSGEPSGDEVIDIGSKISMYIATAVGGAHDNRARVLQPYLEDELDVVIDILNVDGASGTVAAGTLVNNPTTEYDLFFHAVATLTSAQHTLEGLTFTNDDITPLVAIDSEEFGLYISADNKWGFETIEDVIEYGQNSGTVIYGGSAGSTTHIYQAGLYEANNMSSQLLSHTGAVNGITNVLGEHSMITMAGIETARPYVESGDLIPVLQYMAEDYYGYDGYVVPSSLEYGGDLNSGLMMISCRSDLPEEVKAMYEAAIREVLSNPDVVAELEVVGLNYIPEFTRDELQEYVDDMYDVLGELVKLIS